MTAKVYQLHYPPAGRLVRFTDASTPAGRMICVGDLTDCIQNLPWTTVMSMAVFPVVKRLRYVRVSVARAWVMDLEQKQHKVKSRELSRFLDWLESVEIVR